MAKAEQLITDHLDLWTSTVRAQASSGRGPKRKRELYGIKKLRELILDLAVRGLLVPQDPEEESAFALLQRIAEIKSKLATRKTIKREKNLSPFEPGGINQKLPPQWAWSQLSDIATVIRGITFPASEKSNMPENGRATCLRTSNIQEEIDWSDLLYIKEQFVKREDQIISKNDIIMSMANSRELVGKVAIVKNTPAQKTTFGGFLGVIRPIIFEPGYLMACLRSPSTRNKLIESASQTTNIANISLGKLNPLILAVPPLAEQHRIVAKVDELMALCDQLEQEQKCNLETHETLVSTLLNALTSASADASQFAEAWLRIEDNFDILFATENSVDQLKQTILQLAMMGRLVPQDSEFGTSIIEHSQEISAEEMPYAKPPGWKWKRIGDHVNIRGGSQPSKNTFVNEPKDGYTRLIQIRDFKSDNFKTYIPIELANRPFNKEDIMIGRYGPPVFQILRGLEGSYNVALMKADPDLKYITRDYLYYLLQEPRIQKIIIDESERTAGQSGIRLPLLNSIFYGLPPTSEQHCIVAKIESLMALCEQLKANLAQAQATQLNLADSLVEQAI